MKNLIAFIVVAATLLTQPAFAAAKLFDGKTARAKATAHFQTTYQGTDGIWDVNGNTTEVLFFWHNQLMDSFYDANGDLIGTFHNIETSELPASALKQVKADYKGYELKGASVMEKDGQAPVYYVTAESASRMFLLEITQDGEVIVFKTLR
jgi:hypothetical protein